MLPGYSAKFVHSERMTFSFWEAKQGYELPEHKHPHEQVTHVLEGSFELNIDGEKSVLTPGTVAIIPPNTIHSGRAITDSRILDCFAPVREDYRFKDGSSKNL